MKQILLITGLFITIVYPFIVFFGMNYFPVRNILVLLAIPIAFNILQRLRKNKKNWLAWGFLLLGGVVILRNSVEYFLFTPVFINLGLLVSFGVTLRKGQPMIERFARMQTQELSIEQIRYCRRVTQVWCLLFIVNASAGFYTAILQDMKVWVFYNGFLAYLLTGLLFTVEIFYRYWRFRHYTGFWLEPFFKKIFPPK